MSVPRVLVLGGGFGGLELSSILSGALGPKLDLTIVDQGEAFVFGYSKLDVLFGKKGPEEVRLPYRNLNRPGVRFRQERIERIDPANRAVVTDHGRYDADYLVVALGLDYDLAATPGLAEEGQEYYSVAGATKARERLARFSGGRVVVAVASAPYKCPPAPSETVLLTDQMLTERGTRAKSEITLVLPLPAPIPPSPQGSQALLGAFAAHQIRFLPGRGFRAVDGRHHKVVLTGGEELPYDLFLGVPHHVLPRVVEESGLAHDGWVTVDRATLATPHPGVYAVGDLTGIEVPRAGVFAEGAARTVAAEILAELTGSPRPPPYDGAAACYVEFGTPGVGRIDVQFPPHGTPSGTFAGPSAALVEEKRAFGATRAQRWHLA